MLQGLHEVGGGEFFEIEVGLTARGFGLVGLDNDAPDPPTITIHAFGIGFGVLVAGILVAPVHDPEEAVGAGLGADGAEPAVVGAEKVAARLAFEGGADGREHFLVDGVVVDVADEGVAVGVGGIAAALVDLNTCIRGAEVLVLHDAGQKLIRVWILRRTALAHIDAAGCHVEEVIDDASADEEVPRRVVVAAPGIAGAVGEDFEFPGWGRIRAILGPFALAGQECPGYGPCATDPRVKFKAFTLRLAGAADFAVGEDAVGHVKPAVGAPGEAVDELMRVLATKAGEHDTPRVRFVVAIVIAEVDEVRLLSNVDAVVAAKDGAGEIESFDKNGALVGFAVVVSVFEDDDAVAWDLVAGFWQRVVLIVLGLAAEGCGVG